jgi:hypothetical protein
LTVTFSDGVKGGTFSPSTAVTDSTGSVSTSYTLPTKAGSYTLTASASGYASGFFKETALAADLIETGVSDPPATIVDASSFSATDTVQNIGSVPAIASTTRYYLSTTTSKSGSRLLSASRAVPSLDPGASSRGTVTLTVPAGTAAGTYFVLAGADDKFVVPEVSENNNCKASVNTTAH